MHNKNEKSVVKISGNTTFDTIFWQFLSHKNERICMLEGKVCHPVFFFFFSSVRQIFSIFKTFKMSENLNLGVNCLKIAKLTNFITLTMGLCM